MKLLESVLLAQIPENSMRIAEMSQEPPIADLAPKDVIIVKLGQMGDLSVWNVQKEILMPKKAFVLNVIQNVTLAVVICPMTVTTVLILSFWKKIQTTLLLPGV